MTGPGLRRVVVTGLGAITPLGVGVRSTWKRLTAGESGITSLLSLEPQAQWQGLKSTVAGIVPSGGQGASQEGKWNPSDWLSAQDQRRMPKFTQYAIAAAEMALSESGWSPSGEKQLRRTGVCLGSGLSNLDDLYTTSVAFEKVARRRVSPQFVPRILLNMAAGHISMRFGYRGPNLTETTACTTGAHCIGNAAMFIAQAKADVMVAGGSESCIHPLTFAGFGSARSLSTSFNDDPGASCRPFDRDRDGFVVGEGAAVLVLEELTHARARSAPILAELRGYGVSADAHHITAPREDGSGALHAMRMALEDAGLNPAHVDYINAHATGTRIGDKAEVAAIKTLLREDGGLSRGNGLAVSSTKGASGHLLGAAGAIEALISIMTIVENIIPPTLNLQSPDVDAGADLNFVPLRAQEKTVKVAMSNSFGFGGTNASLLFSDLEP